MVNRTFEIHLTESQYQVLKEVARAAGNSMISYLHTAIIQHLQSDVDLYFGHSEALTRELNRKLRIEEASHHCIQNGEDIT